MTAPYPGYAPYPLREPFEYFVTDRMVLHAAALCRPDGAVPFVPLDTELAPFYEDECFSWIVHYSDDSRVMVKVPIMNYADDDKNYAIIERMKCESENLLFLARRNYPWSPRLIYFTDKFEGSAINHPYMIHTLPPGDRLQWTNTFPTDKASREKVLGQLAQIIFDLVLVDQKLNLATTPLEWLKEVIDKEIFRSLRGLNYGYQINTFDCMVLRILAPRLLEGKTTSRIFALSHENIAAHNIFIDDNFNITGLLEWGDLKSIPLRFALRFPKLLMIFQKQQCPIMPSFMRPWVKEYLEVPAIMQADRTHFISRLQYEFATRATPFSIGHLSPTGWEMMCWDLHLVDWSHMMVEAIFHRSTLLMMARHQFFAACLPGCRTGNIATIMPDMMIRHEAWQFFCDNYRYLNPWARGNATISMMRLAIEREMQWNFTLMALMEAFGSHPFWGVRGGYRL